MAASCWQRAAKRAVDIAVSGTVLVLASPVLLTAMLAVRLRLGPPVLFRQTRTGLGMAPLRLVKLRTMDNRCGPDGLLLPDAQRLGRLGRLLRRTSIDELPQLWHVLRGQMSLVGPRPILPRYDCWYTGRELRRFTVRPGITGLAQVNGRNTADWDERLELDVRYAETWSLRMDLRILLRTAVQVVRGSGVVADQRALMPDLDEQRQVRGAAQGTVS